MQHSSFPPEWYKDQARLAAQELDFELHVAALEAVATPLPTENQPIPKGDRHSEIRVSQNGVVNRS